MFNKTVTIHNQYDKVDGELGVQSTAVEGVYYIKDEAVAVRADLSDNADVVFVVIPHTAKHGREIIDKFRFDKLTDDEKLNYFTISSGDFISFGDVAEDITSLTEYRNETGNAYEISAVGDYDVGGLKHYEVSAH